GQGSAYASPSLKYSERTFSGSWSDAPVIVVVDACFDREALIFQHHAGDFAPPQRLAGGLGLLFVEACEPGAVHGLAALVDALGERIGPLQRVFCKIAGKGETVLRFRLLVEGADLNDIIAAALGAQAVVRVLRRLWRHRHGAH